MNLVKSRYTKLKEIGFDDFVRWSLEQDEDKYAIPQSSGREVKVAQ